MSESDDGFYPRMLDRQMISKSLVKSMAEDSIKNIIDAIQRYEDAISQWEDSISEARRKIAQYEKQITELEVHFGVSVRRDYRDGE